MRNHKIGSFVGVVGNEEKHFAHWDKVQPRSLTYLDNPEMCVKSERRYPNCVIIWRQNRRYRAHGGTRSNDDGLLHEVYADPAEFIDERVRILDQLGWQGRVHIKLHNEAAWTPEVLRWQEQAAIYAIKRKVPLAVGGWSVGNPKIAQIPEALPMLSLLGEFPDLLKLVLNEYWSGAWVSGITHDGITGKDEFLYFTKLIPYDKWPKTMQGVTAYHCGRYRQWLKVCDAHQLPYPRIIIGEHLADAVSDRKEIEEWRKGLIKTGSKELRFWQGLEIQWRNWWPQWSVEEALFHQFTEGSLEVVYNHPAIVAVQPFTEGDSGGWGETNLEHALAYNAAIENYAQQDEDEMTFPLPTDPKWKQSVNLSGAKHGILKTIRAEPFAWILPEETFWYYEGRDFENLTICKTLGGQIGYCDKLVLRVAPPPTPEPPPAPPPVDLKHSIDAVKILIGRREDDLQEANHVVARIDTELKLLKIILADLEAVNEKAA